MILNEKEGDLAKQLVEAVEVTIDLKVKENTRLGESYFEAGNHRQDS